MSISISGSNSISGLSGNDTDFDKVLKQLKQIESTQLNRLEAWKSDWNLRYDAFTQIIDQIQAASSMLSKLSDKNNFVTKLVQSSNENVITAVANASAQDVQHTINVSQVASNSIWANTGHVFSSKTDSVNTTGENQYFSFTYAGKRHDIKIPPNTTLDSFASLVNNNTDNPGIKVSLIQTGNGYVFQVAGKDTGVANDLIIHDSKLVGMDATNSSSLWQTNKTLDLDEAVTNPTSYVFDLVLQSGVKKSITVKGDATAEELVDTLNRNLPGGTQASLVDGELSISGVQSFSRRKSDDKAYTPASTRVSVGGDLKDKNGNFIKLNASGGVADGLSDDDLIKFTMTMDDGSTREFEIKAGATRRDLLVQMAQATQDGSSVDIGLGDGGWGTSLKGVLDVSFESDAGTLNAGALGLKTTAATGVKDSLGAGITANTTLTFDQSKLRARIDGKSSGDGEKLRFTILKEDGEVLYFPDSDADPGIEVTSDMTNQQLLDAIKQKFGDEAELGTDDKGNATLKLAGVKSFKLTTGATETKGFSSKLSASLKVPAHDLFFTDDSGQTVLEEAPKLTYTVNANDGTVGTISFESGTTMRDILKTMQNSANWTWSDAEGNPLSPQIAPPDFATVISDADGNVVTDLDTFAGDVFLNFQNVQSASGPGGVTGQVAQSSNWNIQRAANARYQVDNWPIEMESATNKVSDVIDGVVFTIQDEGVARISVSTDITSVEQSIQDFLDAVNSVLLTVNDLMKYDETKEVTSNDPNDIGSDNYSPSGLTNQKGGLLMGNHGVQLFKSRFTDVLTGSPPGFTSRQSATDLLSGDVLASLANMGIKTDTDQNSDTYGLLVIAPNSSIAEIQSMDKENYNNMITSNLEAVVDFFCTSGTGSSTSPDFRYVSHVEGITKGGIYDVKYHVDDSGNITSVTVGGVEAKRDESMPGYYYSVASGDARGLSITIDDLSVGDHPPAGADPMQVRIKEGLVQTVNSFFKDELVYNDVNISTSGSESQKQDAIALKSKNGALMSLRANYMNVMEGIDAKIEREKRRLDTWETRQKAIFANLETLLKQYGEQQKTLEAQLSQLSGND